MTHPPSVNQPDNASPRLSALYHLLRLAGQGLFLLFYVQCPVQQSLVGLGDVQGWVQGALVGVGVLRLWLWLGPGMGEGNKQPSRAGLPLSGWVSRPAALRFWQRQLRDRCESGWKEKKNQGASWVASPRQIPFPMGFHQVYKLQG